MNFVPSNFPDRHLGLPSSHMKNCPEPFGSSPREYFPAEGSFGLFHDVSTVLCPVFVFTLTFIPGRKLSVGCSKLSQIAVPSPDDTTSWPESLIVALVSFVVAVETFVDQTVPPSPSSTSRFPSRPMAMLPSEVARGASRFATHTTDWVETLW
ncbi:G-type lectin S-receptor-like serine/threonine-protein kinase B120 [Iris pallida]|uniref:G-type lectin S-receptor-like serine/threonine-protein kinase B120 n=1 Tax=Iris pallida TaxID=29817 RepID=A0AAX6DPZ7_IRIPA|nr:G-type lectin S-receptor-like serine/threonine-protein kinase B120 [Iris pallida]